jgi:hypothetical protein
MTVQTMDAVERETCEWADEVCNLKACAVTKGIRPETCLSSSCHLLTLSVTAGLLCAEPGFRLEG